MQATRFLLLVSALAAACSSSSQESRLAEQPDLFVSGSCRREEDLLTLAIAVTNRGRGAAAPAAARAVDTFEVELPALCSKAACRWNITVDSPKPVHESGRC
ncbi:MAG TPA: hypothetical protein VNU64_24005 [Burkholderiales bacterium]|nr:hypothetical protein [Burkholderiales bacterium]